MLHFSFLICEIYVLHITFLKQKYDLYAAMTYIGIKANGYKILTITSTIQNHAVSAKTKWTIIMTMLGKNAYGKEVSNMHLGRGCIIYLIIFSEPCSTFEEVMNIS